MEIAILGVLPWNLTNNGVKISQLGLGQIKPLRNSILEKLVDGDHILDKTESFQVI